MAHRRGGWRYVALATGEALSTAKDGAYEAAIVCAFVAAHLEDEAELPFPSPGGRKTARQKTLNGKRVGSGHREMLERWSTKQTVSLEKVDRFLHQYGLMTWELEDWAEQTFGRPGYLTPTLTR